MSDEWDESVLSELSDSEFAFPALDFDDDDGCMESDEDRASVDDVDFDEALIPALSKKPFEIKPIDVLVEIDENRKKVITLNCLDDLEEEFLKVVARDAALKEYANSTVIFQIFSEKFKTWVDIDKSKELTDGTHLKAVFLAKKEITNESNQSKKQKKRKRSHSPDNHKKERGRRHKSKKRRLSQSDDSKSEISRQSCSSNESKRNGSIRITSTATECDNSNTVFKPSRLYRVNTENYGHFSQNSSKCSQKSEKNDILPKELQPVSEGQLHCLSWGLADKNPVSALHELCVRLKWGIPQFEVHKQNLDSNNPQFLMKVTVRGQTYMPETASRKKQLAKSEAAEFCLKKLGVLK